jgi:hypothetical protein
MRRRPRDTWVQVNLRIRETQRAELAAAAKENEVSFNQEVRTRLADSLEQKPRQSLESLAADLERRARDIELAWRRLEEEVYRLGKLHDRVLRLEDREFVFKSPVRDQEEEGNK